MYSQTVGRYTYIRTYIVRNIYNLYSPGLNVTTQTLHGLNVGESFYAKLARNVYIDKLII